MTDFAGFPAELLEFFEGLEADNTKSYWQTHKTTYDEKIAAPMAALAQALEPEFGRAKVFRPYRDVRFSKDKTPYKTQASMVVEPGGSAGALYLQVSADSLFVAGGTYAPGRDQLLRWRQLQDEPLVTADLDRTLAALRKAGYPLSTTGGLKTAPRGWDRDHERIELLRLRSMTVSHAWEPAAWWDTAEALKRIATGWRRVQTWNAWLDAHVGPSTEVSDRPNR